MSLFCSGGIILFLVCGEVREIVKYIELKIKASGRFYNDQVFCNTNPAPASVKLCSNV